MLLSLIENNVFFLTIEMQRLANDIIIFTITIASMNIKKTTRKRIRTSTRLEKTASIYRQRNSLRGTLKRVKRDKKREITKYNL